MFRCEKCQALENEVIHLRYLTAKLTDKLVALADARAFDSLNFKRSDRSEYFGNEFDEYVEHDDMGQRVVVKKERTE